MLPISCVLVLKKGWQGASPKCFVREGISTGRAQNYRCAKAWTADRDPGTDHFERASSGYPFRLP